MTDVDLVVVGAGPAGLGVAWRAARAGHQVVVLERREQVGGLTASIEVAGQRVDLGSHRLHASVEPRILADLRDLLGDDLQRRRRNGRLRLADRWVAFPLRAGDLLTSLPAGFALRAGADAVLSTTRRPRADTFAEHLRAGLGPTMCEGFYFPYARKLWGREPDAISAEQARRRVSADSPLKILRRVLGDRDDPDRGMFYYPRRGFGQIAEALASALHDQGGDLRLSTPAESLETGSSGVRVTADGTTVTAGRVLSTAPVTVLADLVDPPPPERVLRAAEALDYRAMLLVYVVCSVDRHSEFDAHYLPQATTPITRISEPKNYRDGPDPDGRTVLCAEIPCERHDAIWEADPTTLRQIVVATLAETSLARPPIEAVRVVRLPRVYPVYAVGFERHFATLDRWADSLDRIVTFGRQGLFVHDNSHHALAQAWAAADALGPDGGFDHGAWARARRRFQDHVVED